MAKAVVVKQSEPFLDIGWARRIPLKGSFAAVMGRVEEVVGEPRFKPDLIKRIDVVNPDEKYFYCSSGKNESAQDLCDRVRRVLEQVCATPGRSGIRLER